MVKVKQSNNLYEKLRKLSVTGLKKKKAVLLKKITEDMIIEAKNGKYFMLCQDDISDKTIKYYKSQGISLYYGEDRRYFSWAQHKI